MFSTKSSEMADVTKRPDMEGSAVLWGGVGLFRLGGESMAELSRGGEMRASQSILCTAITQKRPEYLNSSLTAETGNSPTPKNVGAIQRSKPRKEPFFKIKASSKNVKTICLWC